MALIRLADKIFFKMDNDELTGLVFVDFHKAFDILDHNLLLKNYQCMVPAQIVWLGFQLYLEGWRQFVKLGHKIIPSQPKPVRKGVLQGSILSPFLFLLFVNDIPLHLNNSTIDIYADDTTLSLSANWNNITSLIKALANDLENIEKWSTENWIVHQYQEDKSITC